LLILLNKNSEADLHDLDFTETVLKERQEDVFEIRKYDFFLKNENNFHRLAHEINLTAQFQARKLHEASQDIGKDYTIQIIEDFKLELVEESTKHTEIQVSEADRNLAETLKYHRRSCRKKYYE